MGLPSRGVIIRLFIYIPLIGFLGWRAMNSRCGADEPTLSAEPSAVDELAPYRKTITLPDGTQQEIVELTPAQAEAVLGQRMPPDPPDDEQTPPSDATAQPDPVVAGSGTAADGEANAEGHADSGSTASAPPDAGSSSD